MRAFPEIQSRLAKLEAELNEANLQTDASNRPSVSSQQLSISPSGPSQDVSLASADKSDAGAAQEGELAPRDTKDSDGLDIEDKQVLIARYAHLKCLHDFIEEELEEILSLRKNIANGTIDRILFEDLWHLYEPGDIIYSKDNDYDQLYRVYFVTGGQSLKRARNRQETTEINAIRDKLRYWIPPEEREENDEDTIEKWLREEGSGIGTMTTLKVDCYFMGFDGEYCGPMDVCKKIRAYVGRREITSLPMFPLRFHPNKDTLLKKMEDRGRKFLFAGGHKSYDGQTLSMKRNESHVEIQSDVYVDFDAFYQSFPMKKPDLGRCKCSA